MARAADLGGQARSFATLLRDLLNRTVCDGLRVTAVVVPDDRDRVIVGTQFDGLLATPVPLSVGRRKPRAWLEVQYRCFLDPRGFLTVYGSYCAVYADASGESMLCHYDYEREKERYACAHLQVDGESKALAAMGRLRRHPELGKLHFPVGGRRYRPSLEDIIEFLIVEGFAEGRTGWQGVLDAERERFLDIQLRAAVRRHPEIARDVLREMDG